MVSRHLLLFLRFILDMLWGNAIQPRNIPSYVMTPELLPIFQMAIEVSLEVQTDPVDNGDDMRVFEDSTDKVLVAFRSESCYVAWDGAQVKNLADAFLQSVLPRLFSARMCGSAGCCQVEQGMAGAYRSDYVEEFERAVDECFHRCDGGCPVILTGHSQGGAIASVAAIQLAQYNPTLVTFGQHRSHRYNCEVLRNMDTYLRVNSVCEEDGRPLYDNIPFTGVGRHAGTFLLVGAGGVATLGYNADLWMMPLGDCHGITHNYAMPIRNLVAGPMDGFVDGFPCTRHMECQSKQCVHDTCVAAR